jgi:endonuclease G
MTNHHVFPVADLAAFRNFAGDPCVEFNYEYDIDGRRPDPILFDLDPERFIHTTSTLDMALIAVKPTDRSGLHKLSSQGYLVLNGKLGKAGVGDFATIIQHPQGNEKQIAVRKNDIITLDRPDFLVTRATRLRAAAEHLFSMISGRSLPCTAQARLRRMQPDNTSMPTGRSSSLSMDASTTIVSFGCTTVAHASVPCWHISLTGKRRRGRSFDPGHVQPGIYGQQALRVLVAPYVRRAACGACFAVVPAVPVVPAAAALATASAVPPISIHIRIGQDGQALTDVRTSSALEPLSIGEQEKFEDDLDFSACSGFQDDFMGILTPIPKPNTALRSKLAFLLQSPTKYILKYHHFSSIHHAVRRVPVVSAINVHGKYRYAALGQESRVDKWYRDNRLDYDVQLNDDFYKKSGFDKGHLSRREDAEWGTSIGKAKLSADMTCFVCQRRAPGPCIQSQYFRLSRALGTAGGQITGARCRK